MMDVFAEIVTHLPYLLTMGMVAVCVYGIAYRSNLFKKILAVYLFTDAVNLLYIIQGYRFGNSLVPILPPGMNIEEFARRSVDPLAHYFVVTAVVIGLAEVAALITLAILVYRHYGTLETKKIAELKG